MGCRPSHGNFEMTTILQKLFKNLTLILLCSEPKLIQLTIEDFFIVWNAVCCLSYNLVSSCIPNFQFAADTSRTKPVDCITERLWNLDQHFSLLKHPKVTTKSESSERRNQIFACGCTSVLCTKIPDIEDILWSYGRRYRIIFMIFCRERIWMEQKNIIHQGVPVLTNSENSF